MCTFFAPRLASHPSKDIFIFRFKVFQFCSRSPFNFTKSQPFVLCLPGFGQSGSSIRKLNPTRPPSPPQFPGSVFLHPLQELHSFDFEVFCLQPPPFSVSITIVRPTFPCNSSLPLFPGLAPFFFTQSSRHPFFFRSYLIFPRSAFSILPSFRVATPPVLFYHTILEVSFSRYH